MSTEPTDPPVEVGLEPPWRRRLQRFEVPGDGRFLTFSCRHRLPLLSNDRIKALLVERIATVRESHRFKLIARVLMPEHIHLMVLPDLPAHPISSVLRAMKRPFAEQVIRRWRELNAPVLSRIRDSEGVHRFWEVGGGYDRNINSLDERLEKVRYIHANPVRRGLAGDPLEREWSSARAYAGKPCRLPLDRV